MGKSLKQFNTELFSLKHKNLNKEKSIIVIDIDKPKYHQSSDCLACLTASLWLLIIIYSN